jgi:lipopolysaccharide transport system ATP-binding protein
MDKPIIEVNNISKSYKISHQEDGYLTLRDSLMNFIKHPIASIKNGSSREIFWALKNISFKVQKGEVIGIIGHNGAGKSTLLKILSQITPPTKGEIKIRGRIASLLEVGTGFHPELTGRENIYLNGAILGMGKEEIRDKFDSIVEFAGIEKFLDTPVKRYSSGMYVRLAFSVAAHLDPDILIVDEVLAVGDAEFQKKCLGKMEEVTQQEGRTILFVSHNMEAIHRLCKKTILLEDGEIKMIGDTNEVVGAYLEGGSEDFISKGDKDAEIKSIVFQKKNGEQTRHIPVHEHFTVDVEYIFYKSINDCVLSLSVFDDKGNLLLITGEGDEQEKGLRDYQKGRYKMKIHIPAQLFSLGIYYFDISIQQPNVRYIDWKKRIKVEILKGKKFKSYREWEKSGKIGLFLRYEEII